MKAASRSRVIEPPARSRVDSRTISSGTRTTVEATALLALDLVEGLSAERPTQLAVGRRIVRERGFTMSPAGMFRCGR